MTLVKDSRINPWPIYIGELEGLGYFPLTKSSRLLYLQST